MQAKNRTTGDLGLLESCLADADRRWGEAVDPRGPWALAYDRQVRCFPQIWGSTALGFGGIGGSAMTTATTVVVEDERMARCGVYFAGSHAYDVDARGAGIDRFAYDLGQCNLASVATARERYPLWHDPLVPISIEWAAVRNEEDFGKDRIIRFDPPVEFEARWREGGKEVAYANRVLEIGASAPWNPARWNIEENRRRLSEALAAAWIEHVDSRGDPAMRAALTTAGRENRPPGAR